MIIPRWNLYQIMMGSATFFLPDLLYSGVVLLSVERKKSPLSKYPNYFTINYATENYGFHYYCIYNPRLQKAEL